jgi:hypothetical protein
MISCLAPLGATAGEAATRRVAFAPRPSLGTWPGHRERRALEVVDLARVKINQPQPWTPASLRLVWSHRTDVPHIVPLPARRLISAVYRVWRPFAGQAWWPSSQLLRSRDFMRSVNAGRL